MKLLGRAAVGWTLVVAGSAREAAPLPDQVRAWRVAHQREVIDEYRELLAIPNMTVDRANIRRNADFIVGMMQRRGI